MIGGFSVSREKRTTRTSTKEDREDHDYEEDDDATTSASGTSDITLNGHKHTNPGISFLAPPASAHASIPDSLKLKYPGRFS
jgi:hypothetical protein